MKRLPLYIIVIALSFLAPLKRVDVAKLQPIEAVAVTKTEGQVLLLTDTGDQGVGQSAKDALNDLKNNTPAVVYLDTAKYLLVAESAVDEVEALRNDLKGTVKLCLWDENGDLKSAAKYLDVHGDLPKLSEWRMGLELPVFISEK